MEKSVLADEASWQFPAVKVSKQAVRTSISREDVGDEPYVQAFDEKHQPGNLSVSKQSVMMPKRSRSQVSPSENSDVSSVLLLELIFDLCALRNADSISFSEDNFNYKKQLFERGATDVIGDKNFGSTGSCYIHTTRMQVFEQAVRLSVPLRPHSDRTQERTPLRFMQQWPPGSSTPASVASAR